MTPDIIITGPTSLGLGQVGKWTIDAVLHEGSTFLDLDIYGIDTLSVKICSSKIVGKGIHRQCACKEHIDI